jgi:hypothetical protein
MVKIRQSAVYNSRILYMLTTRSSFLRTARPALVALILCSHAIAWAGDWDTTEQQFAAKIIAVVGAGPAAIEMTNRSSLGQTEVEAIRREITGHLFNLGLKLSAVDSVAASIHISLSENVQEYVWIAEIRKSTNEPAVVMVSRSRLNTSGVTREVPASSLHKLLLWSSDSQILDAIVINGALPRMAVLYPGQIQFYRLQSDHWVEDQALPVTHSHAWPRDLRGQLVLRKDHLVEAHLPGVICQSSAAGPLSVSCRDEDVPWPIGTDQSPLNAFFTQSRNFFTGVVSPGIGKQTTVPAFYSAAPVSNERSNLWLIAAVDGRIHLLDGSTDLILPKLNWGSGIAAIHSSCGSRLQILSTTNGSGQEDAVRGYEMPGREPIAVGSDVSFPGSVTSLWTDADENGAVAVVRNSGTGKYEAYLLTMACSQ